MDKVKKTAIDYLLVALCQVLIGLFVGSLGFFLIKINYQGPYDGRLTFIMAMFVMGTVGIARISLEEGAEHAILYSVALGLVAFLAIMRFVEFDGRWKVLTPFFNAGILVLIWWAAHQLTRDCSFVDKADDPGGRGLLASMGLGGKKSQEQADSLLSTEALEKQPLLDEEAPGWWRRWLKRRRRPHAPGLWIVYFSLAALPLFGLGQTLIPEADEDMRRSAFQLLLLYVASGLSLLLLTSFLGLRRYLRNRSIAMPLGMSGIWLGIGLLIIGGLMVFSMLMPRPGQPWVVSEAVSWLVPDEDQSTSENALGDDGTLQGEGGGEGDEPGEGDGSDDRSGSDGQRPGDQQQGSGTPGEGGMPGGEGQDGNQPGGGQGGEQGNGGGGDDGENAGSEEGDQGESTGDGSEEDPEWSFQLPEHLAEKLPGIIYILFWVAVVVITLFVLWRHGRQLWRALLEILRGLAALFGFSWALPKRESDEPQLAAPPPPPRHFSDFPDPFSSGQASRWSHHQLVYYSFHALEAWAREAGLARDLHETPIEFVQLLQTQRHDLSADVGQLGQLYSRANYAPGTLPVECIEQLRAFWNNLPVIHRSEPVDSSGEEGE
jgi:hypothetical protein